MLTPQLFVGSTKLCDEDVDLGLEFSLGIMLRQVFGRHADEVGERQVIAARIALFTVLLAIPVATTGVWIGSAKTRLAQSTETATAQGDGAPVASQSDVGYCSPELKKILRRVLMSCGPRQRQMPRAAVSRCRPRTSRRCPAPTSTRCSKPMKDRGGIVEFDKDKAELAPRGAPARRSSLRRSARRELVLRRRARVA